MLSVLSVLCTKHGWRRLRIPAPLRRHVSSDPFGLENVGSSSAQVDVVSIMPRFGIIIRNMEETVNLLNPSRRTRNKRSYDLACFCPPVWLVNHWFPCLSALWKPYFSGGATLLPLLEEFLPFTRWNKVLTRSTGQEDLRIVLNKLDYCELCMSTTSLFRNLSTILIHVLL